MNPGWANTSIYNLFDFKYGKGLPKGNRSIGEVNVYGSNGVIGQHNKALTNEQAIIVGRKGSVGEVHFSEDKCWSIDTTYYVDEFHANIPPKYWFYYLKSLRLGQHDKSSAIPGVSREDIYKLVAPVPPTNEQHRIVAKLEKLLAKVDKCKERLEKIPAILKRFRQSVLAAACSGELTVDWREKNQHVKQVSLSLIEIEKKRDEIYKVECSKAKKEEKRKPPKPTYFEEFNTAWDCEIDIPDLWAYMALGRVCKKITDGTHDTPKPTESGVPFITAQHIKDRFINFSDSFFLPKAIHDKIYARCNPDKGDVVIVNIGAGTATPALVKVDFEFSMKNVALLKPDPMVLIGDYLEYHQLYLKSQIFNKLSRGGAQPFIGLDLIKTLPICLPPIEEQYEIIRQLNLLFDIADQIEHRYKKAKIHIDKLTQSILAKAFSGKLVPQDPNDEPACVLLKRIQAEREQAKDKQSKARKTIKS